MASVCLYFKVHQPCRLKQFQPQDIGGINSYTDTVANRIAIDLASDSCYLPVNELLKRLISQHKGKFKISFSISGIALDLLTKYRPEVITSFKSLVETGCVEILGETYYHSLAFLHSVKEFERQVTMHASLITDLFGSRPSVFRNTELIYNNQLAGQIGQMGFRGILCEGVERELGGRSPNQLYAPPCNNGMGLLLRNATLSDTIAFRFDKANWSGDSLTADKFAGWLHSHPENTALVNLFIDYQTFGIHKQEENGIFDFLSALPEKVLSKDNFEFSLPSEVLQNHRPVDIYDVARTISWEDRGDASCVWSGNMRQHNSLKKIHSIEKIVMATGCNKIIDRWGRLQSADHFYYMADENGKYRNPFSSREEAFSSYQNIVTDFEISLIRQDLERSRKNRRRQSASLIFF